MGDRHRGVAAAPGSEAAAGRPGFLPLLLLVEMGAGATALAAALLGEPGLVRLASQIGLSAAVTALVVGILCRAPRFCAPVFVLMTWVLADGMAQWGWLGTVGSSALTVAAVLALYGVPGLPLIRVLPGALLLSVAAATLAEGAPEWTALLVVNLLGWWGAWRGARMPVPTAPPVDSLGGLAATTDGPGFFELGERALRRTRRRDGPFALLLMDVDRFGDLVARHGVASGDGVLRELGAALRTALRDGDIVGRVGDDELAACLPYADEAAAWGVARRILARIDQTPFAIGDREVPLTVSIGIAQRSGDTRDLADLLCQAEVVLWSAKQGGPRSIRAGQRLETEGV